MVRRGHNSFYPRELNGGGLSFARFDKSYKSVVAASLKYIAGSAGRPELYDIRQDPGESRNLYNPDDRLSREAAERLSAWNRSVAKKAGGVAKIDNETLERLRSLGYVGK